MDRFLITLNTLLIFLGLSAPLLWHFYIGPLWVKSGTSHNHNLGTALGVIYGYSLAFIILVLCGGVVYVLSKSAIKKDAGRQWFRWQKYIGSAMAIVPLAASLLISLSLLIF